MGVCWHSTGDSTKTKSNRLTNQIITASNIIKDSESNKNEIQTDMGRNNKTVKLNSSLEESRTNFRDMPEWGGGIMKGYGIKEMPAYKCDLKIDELNKLREEFWSSKNKLKTKWKIIHQACIYDHINAEEFLSKNNIKTLEGCINMCMDNQGNVFRVPNYCINDPHFQLELLDKNEGEGENIEIQLYDVKNQKHNKITVLDSITGKELIEKYANKEKIDLTQNKIRLLFGGGIIKENETLFQHKVKNGFSIQICISQL